MSDVDVSTLHPGPNRHHGPRDIFRLLKGGYPPGDSCG